MGKKITNLLYTGGWDSTYRMLYLLLVEKRMVQPVYLTDPGRHSLAQEFKAMDSIKETLLDQFPAAKELIQPTIIFDITDLKPDPDLKQIEQELLKRMTFGSQYEWLARAAKQLVLDNVETCVEKAGEKTYGAYAALQPLLEKGDDGVYRFSDDKKETPEYKLFGLFTYPLFETRKSDMLRSARIHGFDHILEMTWFCHKPNIFGQPCGMCNPCKDAMTMDMKHRIPALGQFCYYAKMWLDPRVVLKKYPPLFNTLRTWKRKLLQQQ